jgi:hypothetical protein
MGPTGCPETSEINYQSTLLNIPEERISHLRRAESLKSRTGILPISGWDLENIFSWRCSFRLATLPDLRSRYGPEGPAQVGTEYTYGQVRICRYAIKGRPVETQSPTLWNLISRNMTAQAPVLSPSSILPPPLCHLAFITTRKYMARVWKSYFSFLLLFNHFVKSETG